jgi:hypothetical protein
MTTQASTGAAGRLGALSADLKELRERLRQGGGAAKVERQHEQGKLTARERVALLLDEGDTSVEIGLLVAHDLYEGRAPAAGVVTVVGRIGGREAVVVANDATGHGENVAELKKRKILIDGKKGALLLQIFSENQLGPIFFEFIQRKGDDGFGEGNFKALFESIEADQIARGVLDDDAA